MAALNKYHILTLGKSPDFLTEALQGIAPESYEIVETENPENCYEKAQEQEFNLTLLQLQSDTNEIKSLCNNLKKNKTTKKIPIIISTESSKEEEISSMFDSGVFDVISPENCSEMLLKKRIEVALKTYDQEIKLQSKLDRAKETAFCAMADSNELGQVITFLNNTANTSSYDLLASHCFTAFETLKLSGSIVFHSKDADFFYSDCSTDKPLEQKLISTFHNTIMQGNDSCGRFKTFSSRIIITSSLCSVLIRNAPLDDTKQGRLRDILGALINGMEARAETIEANLKCEANKEITHELFTDIRQAMENLGSLFKEHEHETINIMDELMHSTQEGLALLGLTEEQEEYFVKSIDSAMTRLIGLYTKGVEFDNGFNNILQQLSKLSSQL